QGGVPAQLQGADVGNDRPAVLGGDLLGVARHGAHAVSDDVEVVAVGGHAQRHLDAPGPEAARQVLVEVRRRREATLDDHALAGAGTVVAGGAEYVETLLAAAQGGGHVLLLDRQAGDELAGVRDGGQGADAADAGGRGQRGGGLPGQGRRGAAAGV